MAEHNPSDHYTVRVRCKNCDHVGAITLPKGTLCSGWHECGHCGCKTAKKIAPVQPIRFDGPTYELYNCSPNHFHAGSSQKEEGLFVAPYPAPPTLKMSY